MMSRYNLWMKRLALPFLCALLSGMLGAQATSGNAAGAGSTVNIDERRPRSRILPLRSRTTTAL